MLQFVRALLALVCAVGMIAPLAAQPPGGRPPEGRGQAKDPSASSLVTRMMAFDKNGDGKLTKDEITDPRLLRLFEQADTNGDGVVTREELVALAAKLEGQGGQRDERGGARGADDRRGPDGPPGGRGPEGRGPGGPGGFGGPPQPGLVLPPPVQDRLNLTADQKKQLEALQKEVDGKLAKILTDAQMKQLKEMQQAGPGGRGAGGRGPGGRPPGDRPPGDRPPER
jgi:hypothetical protein